ncbi:hypothetical protein KY290_031047 [Solanum tuberosum]|uniref:Ty3 transposon capsid-like protein domain-containing protein n=1 Tax=Solanum tuberosum TaxID=4113 RepID=A0ABQ7U8W8_SOLTU|nr:hypothetical protein KY290_031047 [Solanum tuberosum]
MVKGTRSNGNSSNEAAETVELRDMMQQLTTQLVESEGNNQKKGYTEKERTIFTLTILISVDGVPAEEKVGVAALQLKGEVIQWHLCFMRYTQFLHPATWNEYVMVMVERFGTDFDDPMEEIKKVKQMGSVKEYQVVFERNLTRVNLSQENAISCFIGRLKHELNIVVKVTNPTTLAQVYRSASLQEAYIAVVRQPAKINSQVNSRRFTDQRNYNSKPILPTPRFGGSNGFRGMNKRTLSVEEMNEKRSKGLCYFCNEKYIHVHKCKTFKELYLLELDEPVCTKCIIWIQNIERCEIRSTSPQLVAAVNGYMRVDKMTTISWLLQGAEFTADFLLLPLGCCGVVLGIQWLLTLGDIKMNFTNLTMELWYKRRKHLLRGTGNQVLTVVLGS